MSSRALSSGEAYYDALLEPYADPTKCAIANREYERQARFSNLFTAALFVLVSATVVFLVVMLAFLVLSLSAWSNDDVVAKIVKLATSLVTAAGAFVTGKAAAFVKDSKTVQDQLTADAEAAALKACGVQPPAIPAFSLT